MEMLREAPGTEDGVLADGVSLAAGGFADANEDARTTGVRLEQAGTTRQIATAGRVRSRREGIRTVWAGIGLMAKYGTRDARQPRYQPQNRVSITGYMRHVTYHPRHSFSAPRSASRVQLGKAAQTVVARERGFHELTSRLCCNGWAHALPSCHPTASS